MSDAPAIRPMSDAALKYAVPLVALFAAGPLCYRLTQSLQSGVGSGDTTLLGATSLGGALLALVVTFGLAAGFAWLGARLLGARAGLLAAAYVVAWAAWGLGEMSMVYRETSELSAMVSIKLALETAIFGVGSIAVVLLAIATDRNPQPALDGVGPSTWLQRSLTPPGVLQVGVAAAAALAVAFVITHTGTKGQAIFGAALAGLIAPFLAGVVAKEGEVNPIAPVVGVALAGVLAPLIAIGYPGLGSVPGAVVAGDLPGFLRLQPADWAVAVLGGVPIGLGWAGLLIHHEHASVEAS